MELGMFIELITTVGFPIACVIVLGIFIFKIYNQSVIRENKLMAEIEENRKINDKAIETIALYAERLTHIENNITEIKDEVIEIKRKLD